MTIPELLNQTTHRPWPIPQGKWQYYQEWNEALFIHWEVPFETLRELVPKSMILDQHEGKYYVSIVAFTMQQTRPRNLPAWNFVSDFHEINVRTYIEMDGKKGVYFLNIEGGKSLSCLLARKLSGLPYGKASIQRSRATYKSINAQKGFKFDVTCSILGQCRKTELDLWLTERYCLFHEENEHLFRYDIHHVEWPLNYTRISHLDLDYNIGALELKNDNYLAVHYSRGVKVVSWKREQI